MWLLQSIHAWKIFYQLFATCLGMQREKYCLHGAEFPEEQRRNEDTLQTVEHHHWEDRQFSNDSIQE